MIAAIVSGKAPVCRCPGENRNWLTAVAASDIRKFVRAVRAVRAELGAHDQSTADEWIGNQTAAEMLGVNQVAFWKIVNDRRRILKADRIRRHNDSYRPWARAEVERFARKYVFSPEIQRRAGIGAARFVRPWLDARGVGTAFRLEEQRNFGYLREKVEQVLREEREAV